MLHPTLQAISDAAREADLAPLRTLSPSLARERIASLRRSSPAPSADVEVADSDIRGVPVRTYEPSGRSLATVVYAHSGGWMLGDLDGPDAMLRRIAAASGLRYVSIDYRLAPEWPFPCALEDVEAVLGGVFADGGPVILHGDSAGGNLVAVVAARHRDDPQLLMQVLVYPVTDADLTRGSYLRDDLPAGFLEADDMEWFWRHYAGDRDRTMPALSPLHGPLASLPPTLVVTAEHDPLRDEGIAYAQALDAAGVDVEHWHADDCTHGFIQMAGMLDRSDEYIDRIAFRLRSAASQN